MNRTQNRASCMSLTDISHSYRKDKNLYLPLFLKQSIIRPNFCSSKPFLQIEDNMRKPILAFLFLAFCLVAAAHGQGTTSRVTGTVQDANGASVPGAMVTLTNEATGVSFTTDTSDSGAYAFDLVQVGNYSITIEKQGFKKFISKGTPVNVNQPATVNATLETGVVSETVTVQAGVEQVQTST